MILLPDGRFLIPWSQFDIPRDRRGVPIAVGQRLVRSPPDYEGTPFETPMWRRKKATVVEVREHCGGGVVAGVDCVIVYDGYSERVAVHGSCFEVTGRNTPTRPT